MASALSGAAQNMVQLLAGRALQGVGGGGIAALTFVIIGDLVSPRERGRYMGWLTGTYTSAALVGPLVGGFFVDNAHWRWIFYAKMPFAAVALVIVSRVLRLPFSRTRRRVDIEGAGLLVSSVTLLILVMTWGGDRMAWTSPTIVILSILCVATGVAFVRQERRAAEPMIPLRIFRSRIVALATAMSLAAGAAMMAANAFVPLFLQVVSGTSATASGLALAPLMIMFTLGSIVAGNLMTRRGRYKNFVVVGPILAVIGLIGLTRLDQHTTPASLLPWLILLGTGMGFVMPTATTIAQNALPSRDLGVGTATVTFARNLGGTIGVGAYGAALAARMDAVLTAQVPVGAKVDTKELLTTPDGIRLLPTQFRDVVIDATTQGTTTVFAIVVPVALAMVVCGAFTPEVPLRSGPDSARPAEGGDTPTGSRPNDPAAFARPPAITSARPRESHTTKPSSREEPTARPVVDVPSPEP